MLRTTLYAWAAALTWVAGCAGEETGALSLAVISSEGAPIAGATIERSGRTIATTDAAGMAQAALGEDVDLVALVVRAEGFAPHVVVGAAGGERRIALDHADVSGEVLVTGTVPGWDALPEPAAGRYW